MDFQIIRIIREENRGFGDTLYKYFTSYLIDPHIVILLVLGWYLLRIQYCVLSQNSDQFYYVQLNFFKWELDIFFFTYWYTNILAILYIDIENLLKFYSYVKHTGGYMCTCI